MAKRQQKTEATRMRLQGKSYSEIKSVLKVSKSTLSLWLQNLPLSSERIRELRDLNPRRIERFRETMRRKREARMEVAYNNMTRRIGRLTSRDLFIAGLILYWGEGGKTKPAEVSLSNTDPVMICFFLKWLKVLDANNESLRIRLHLYSDMDIEEEMRFWSETTGVPLSRFRKPYIKTSKQVAMNWRNPSKHGTCNVIVYSQRLYEDVQMGLKRVKDIYGGP